MSRFSTTGEISKALVREDEASLLRPQIAISKAWDVLGMGESSRSPAEHLKDRPAFLSALSDMSGGKVVPVAGGVLIMDGDDIIGGVGACGGTADEDEPAPSQESRRLALNTNFEV